MRLDNWDPAAPTEVARRFGWSLELFAGRGWRTHHDIWCRPTETDPWRIQVMLDESAGEDWVSRRNPQVHRPIATIGHVDPAGIPYLAPEIQLFYKAKGRRPQDGQDFAEVLPLLDADQRSWLQEAITITYGAGNPWANPTAPPR